MSSPHFLTGFFRWKLGSRKFICLLTSLVAMANADACNVPVFRYAFERWMPDPYVVNLTYQGKVPEPQLVATLKKTADQSLANFEFKVTEVSAPSKQELPWVSVEFPQSAENAKPVWSGPFTTDTGRFLLDSPARRELVRRLIGGDSVVWVVIDGDDATINLLNAQLRKLEKELVLPPPDLSDPNTRDNSDLKIVFSVLPISRTDPAEKFFVSMLLNSDPAVMGTTGPIAFPVFGRGRVLNAVAGKDINASRITGIADYVCGSCSCEIKRSNPGVDLLLAADWDALPLTPAVKDPPLPPLVSLASGGAPVQVQPSPSPTQVPISLAPNSTLQRNLVSALSLLLIAVIIGTLVIRRKS